MTEPERLYHRNDAWGGNALLAMASGLIAGFLSRQKKEIWSVESPFGYAPVIDIVFSGPSKQRFRLRIEEVPAEEEKP